MTMCQDFNPDTEAQLDCINCGRPFEAHAKPKRQMTIASFCAMTCAEGGFHNFLGERFAHYADGAAYDTKLATVFVKDWCGISSRTELNRDEAKRDRWLVLQGQYQDWLRT